MFRLEASLHESFLFSLSSVLRSRALFLVFFCAQVYCMLEVWLDVLSCAVGHVMYDCIVLKGLCSNGSNLINFLRAWKRVLASSRHLGLESFASVSI
jgi:hypothetical protein